MRSFEKPPRPPENYFKRQLIIALLVFIADHIKGRKETDVLLFAPIHGKTFASARTIASLSPVDLSEVYKILRNVLNDDLEKSDESLFDVLVSKLEARNKDEGEAYSQSWSTALQLAQDSPIGIFNSLLKRKEPIDDQSFVKKFKYNTMIRGMNNEVLALSHTTNTQIKGYGKQDLLLGMRVRFEKKSTVNQPLIKGPGTGELTGEGTIFFIDISPSFHLSQNQNSLITDRIIEVAGTTEEGPFHTFLSPDEIIIDHDET